jgi:hypothetical protein
MKRRWDELTESEKEVAKQCFMQYQSIASIASELKVPRTTVQYHASTYWHPEREMLKAELFSRFTATKRSKFIEMSESSINIIAKALTQLANRDMPPTTREAKDAVSILEALDKITRLDDGRPTEILEEKVMNISDIQAIASLVPFKSKAQLEAPEDIEFEEKEDDKKNQ